MVIMVDKRKQVKLGNSKLQEEKDFKKFLHTPENKLFKFLVATDLFHSSVFCRVQAIPFLTIKKIYINRLVKIKD